MTTPEQHISEIRNVKLTDTERAALRNTLHAYTLSYIPERPFPVKLWQWAGHHTALAIGLAVLLIAGGTGVSANWAGPGDALYDFRLRVNDRVQTALTFDEDAQIDIEMRQMQRMIDGEDALRDEELSDVAFTDDDESFEAEFEAELESELEYEDVSGPTTPQAPDDSDYSGSERQPDESEETPTTFDDGSFDRELRSIELELQAEERAGLELEL